MAPPFLTLAGGTVIDLHQERGHHRPAHVIDRRSVAAINAALAAGRPLLVRGEPGVGKSQLALAAAIGLGRRFRSYAVDASTEARDLLYTVDAVARLAEAQLIGALGRGSADEQSRARVALENFVRPGALWWAFDWESAAKQASRAGEAGRTAEASGSGPQGVVLLIDEIDKADSAVPNALLDALGHGKFSVPGGVLVEMRARPLVVITTNEERSLPDAFLRRCLVLHLGLPDRQGDAAVREALRVCGAAHFPGCGEPILDRAAELIAERRSQSRGGPVPPPGVAEYIDLINAVLEQQAADASVDALALLEEISMFVLDKHAAPERDA